MKMDKELIALIGDSDQEQALADEWYRNAPSELLMRVWCGIQATPNDGDVKEIIRRLAQKAFVELYIKHQMRNEEVGDEEKEGQRKD